MTLGEKLKQARKEANLTQEELAQKADGPSRTQIVAYEKNQYQPTMDNLKKMAAVLGKPLVYFTSSLTAITPETQTKEPSSGNMILPILREYAYWEDDSRSNEFIFLPTNLIAGADFALRVKSTAMAPRIIPGDLVLIRRQDFFEDGNVIMVEVNGLIEICRAFHREQEIVLINFNGEEIAAAKEFQIIGKAVKNICSFE